jgi:hypothetical protein
MKMKDHEVFDADLFELTGLSEAPDEEKIAFVQEFGRLLGTAGIILARDQLSEKDQDIYARLLEREEIERATAFLVSRDIDLEEVIAREAIRIKRAVIELGQQMESALDLLIVVKAQFPTAVLELDIVGMHTAITEVQAYLDTLPLSDEQKARLTENIEKTVTLNVLNLMNDFIPPDVIDLADQLMEEDKWGEAFHLLLSHGFDYVQVSAAETRSELRSLNERISSLEDILRPT